jgi:hypothetical protein
MRTLLTTAAVFVTLNAANAAGDVWTNNNPACQHDCQSSTVITPAPLPAPTGPVIQIPTVITPAPLGWISSNFVECRDHENYCYVSVRADGANIRRSPGGYVFMALVNRVPVVALDWSGNWTQIGVPCDLHPTGLRSDTMHGVSLKTCSGE